jgi:hypothetical protein
MIRREGLTVVAAILGPAAFASPASAITIDGAC